MMSNYYGNNDHYGSGGQGGGNYYGHNDHYGSGGQGGGNYYGNNDPYGSGGQGGGNRNNNKRGNSGGGYGNNNYNNYNDGNPYGQDRDRYNRGDNSNRMQWPRNSIQQEPHESPFPAPPSVKHDDEWKKREQNLQMLLQCSDQEKNYKEYMELSEEDKRRVFFKLPETIFQVINKLHEEKEEARKTLIEHEKTQKQLEVSKKCNPGLQIEMDFLTRLRQKVGIGQTQNESLQLQNQNKELPQQIASKKSADDSNWNKLRSELKLLRSELELKNQVANENKRALDELKQESQKEGEKLKEKNQSYLKEIERLKSASREGNKVKNPPRGPDKTVRKRRTCNVCKEVCKYPIPPNPNCLEPIPNCNGSGQQIYCKYYYLKAKANKVAKL